MLFLHYKWPEIYEEELDLPHHEMIITNHGDYRKLFSTKKKKESMISKVLPIHFSLSL